MAKKTDFYKTEKCRFAQKAIHRFLKTVYPQSIRTFCKKNRKFVNSQKLNRAFSKKRSKRFVVLQKRERAVGYGKGDALTILKGEQILFVAKIAQKTTFHDNRGIGTTFENIFLRDKWRKLTSAFACVDKIQLRLNACGKQTAFFARFCIEHLRAAASRQ